MPAGFVLLPRLAGVARARLTQELLRNLGNFPKTLTFEHHERRNQFEKVPVEHPLRWLLREYGSIQIGKQIVQVNTVLARIGSPALQQVKELQDSIPRLIALATQSLPKPSSEELGLFWRGLRENLATPERIRNGDLKDLWNGAAADSQFWKSLPSPNGNVPLTEAYVTGSQDLARRARDRGRLVFELDEVARKLWLGQGAQSLDDAFKVGWTEALAPVCLLQDAIPDIAVVLAKDQADQTYSQSVQGLHLSIEDHPDPVFCIHWQGVLYLDPGQLDALPRQDRLLRVLREASTAGWLNCGPDEAIRRIADATLEARRAEVAAAAGLAERLLQAVGGDVEALMAALGERACSALPPDAEPLQVAELALALLGPTVLQALRGALEAADLRPPNRWGTEEARAFVLELRFPEAFAVAQTARRDAEFWVSGPIPLPPLHDFQEEVADGLRALIEGGTGRRRAVVSLPTGGGKTRVTVQAAVDRVLAPPGPRRTVLWIAQTDELCEQAVQSFRQVWLNRGAQATDLRVVRFWGGAGNPSAPAAGEPTVVVASIQTLNSRIDLEALRWLKTPGLVVVDECHHAITKSYTNVLRWLDAEAPRPGASAKEEPPFIGLSATPFRGIDEEGSDRLARRFDQRWLPTNQQDLYARLRSQGVLAHADHEPLESNTTVSTDLFTELEDWDGTTEDIRLDGLFERVNQDLAGNATRNELLLQTIDASDAHSILFFTNSVGHAEEMAARLCLRSIPAAAVSGETPRTARRWFLDRFQSGEIRVLCNHSVLTTGFDAPKTDLVLIARQVKSPVRYMQMVGRGLRGPLNGGTARCRIITVLDNLGRFGNRQPFDFCSKFYISG
ncbi:DEAD/DEAH box helicase [uncultured Lamprocystis sp.]|jgi:superfamily II DNA or RNA helicase|uniref:DEAD/DEAH box helicase n=5 Tax=uncultured Lamprocystis sp. TaxID=543132 RepID=UPI0025DA402D|nr:DEAD/DEAH box helicase [uncultured Lamprocystis sp.]